MEPITTAHEFALRTGGDYAFGTSPINGAAALRRLADRIEARQAGLQKIKTTQWADSVDYTRSEIIITYTEKAIFPEDAAKLLYLTEEELKTLPKIEPNAEDRS